MRYFNMNSRTIQDDKTQYSRMSVRLSRKLSDAEVDTFIHIIYQTNIQKLLSYGTKFNQPRRAKQICRKIYIPTELYQMLLKLDINVRNIIEDLIINA